MKKKLSQFYPEIILLILVTVLVGIWFRQGQMLATGESGMPFHNFTRLLPRTRYAWTDALLGSPSNQAAIPFLSYIWLTGKIGLSPFLSQACLYWLLLSIGVLSVCRFSRALFSHSASALFAGMFYLLNLFTMVSVINRLLYPFLFFYALLPLSLWLTHKFLERRFIWGSLIISLITVPFSLSLASFPFLELWWIAVILFGFYRPSAFKFYSLLIISWLGLNLWWFGPLLQSTFSTPYATSEAVTASGNIGAFLSLSRLVGGVTYVLALMDRSFFVAAAQTWGSFYLHPLAVSAALLVPLLVIVSFFDSRLNRAGKFLLGVYIGAAFFAKGASAPLGDLSIWLVSHFRFLEVFRNSFEKIGFLLIIPAALLFGKNLTHLPKLLAFFIGFVIFGILVYPLWTGRVLQGDAVEPPGYYREADAWLSQQSGDFRFIAMPITGEGATYDWPKSYSGVEVSSELFSPPVISFTTSVPFLESINTSLEKAVSHSPPRLAKLLSLLNARYLMIRRDIFHLFRQVRDPQVLKQTISPLPDFSPVATFGRLDLFQVRPDTSDKFIYPSAAALKSYPKSSFGDTLLVDVAPPTILVDGGQSRLDNFSAGILIKPNKDFTLPPQLQLSLAEAMAVLPSIKHQPGEFTYPLITLKENIERVPVFSDQVLLLTYDLNMLGKRMAEIHRLVLVNSPALTATVSRYKFLFTRLFLAPDSNAKIKALSPDLLYLTLAAHSSVLADAAALADSASSEPLLILRDFLRSSLADIGLSSLYLSAADPSAKRILRLDVVAAGQYQINMAAENFPDYYLLPDDKIVYLLDGESFSSPLPFPGQEFITLGSHRLSPGTHELTFPLPPAKNLASVSGELVFSTGLADPPLSISSFQPGSQYDIGFDYRVTRGDGLEFKFIQDIDYVADDSRRSYSKFRINKDGYNHDWQRYSTSVSSYLGASGAKLEFFSPPYSFCPGSKNPIFDKCADPDFKKKFQKTSQVLVKNLRLTRRFTNPIWLWQPPNTPPGPLPQINYLRRSPTSYTIQVRSASRPFLLVMSQLYHPGWQAGYAPNSQIIPGRFLANGYANGWLVDKTGSFDIFLRYSPQIFLTASRVVSALSLLFVISVLCWRWR